MLDGLVLLQTGVTGARDCQPSEAEEMSKFRSEKEGEACWILNIDIIVSW